MRILLLAHIVLMTGAVVFVISAVLSARRKKPGWFKKHRTKAVSGVVCAVAAFALVFISKSAMHFPHFYSIHAVAGLITFIMLVITPITGALVASGAGSLRVLHRWLGKITSLALVLTALAGIIRFIGISRR